MSLLLNQETIFSLVWRHFGQWKVIEIQQKRCFLISVLHFPFTESRKFLLYARQIEIRGVDVDNPYYNYIISFTVPDIDNVTVVDYDAVEHRIYWSDVRTQTIKRAFINGTGVETVVSAGRKNPVIQFFWVSVIQFFYLIMCFSLFFKLNHKFILSQIHGKPLHLTLCLLHSLDLPNAHGLAVDWVSRNLFWTSYDANKKQINVARLDGSFKNAVIQGLDKPHCLVAHPLLGWVLPPVSLACIQLMMLIPCLMHFFVFCFTH